MAESKLKNIQALKQMMDGTHRTQTKKTIGFSDVEAEKERNKVREVGEVWTTKDANGNDIWWTQHQGWRSKSSYPPETQKIFQEIIQYGKSFPNCQKETCTCIKPNHLDNKFRNIHGMCFDCVISMETKLKIQGKFDQYAIDKMKANAESFFNEADKEVEVIKRAVTNINFAGDENDVNPIETWSFQDPESFIEKIDEDYANFKKKTLESFERKENKS